MLQKSPIFFLIYISRVFLKMKSYLQKVTCLLFIDDLRFLVTSNSVIRVKKIPKKLEKLL